MVRHGQEGQWLLRDDVQGGGWRRELVVGWRQMIVVVVAVAVVVIVGVAHKHVNIDEKG